MRRNALVLLMVGVLGVVEGSAVGHGDDDPAAMLRRGDYLLVIARARARLAALDAAAESDPDATAATLDLLVSTLIASGRVADRGLLELAERAVALRRGRPEDRAGLARSLANLGNVLGETGRSDEAEQVLTAALAAVDQSRSAELARTMCLLAWVHVRQHRRAEAEQALIAACAAAERAGPAGTVELARCLSARGSLLVVVGQPAQAEPLLRRAVAVVEPELGPHHPEVGRAVLNLALGLRRLGLRAEAEAAYRRALQIVATRLGSDNPMVATCNNGLGLLAKERGDYLAARRYYEAALTGFEAQAEVSPAVAGIQNNLGNLCKLLGDLAAARRHLERALAIRESLLGPDHPDVAQALTNLAAVLLEEERPGDAIAPLRRALAIRERRDGGDGLAVAAVLENLGNALLAVESHREAEETLRRALAIIEAQLGAGHPSLAGQLHTLGLIELRWGDPAEGFAALERARGLLEAAFGPAHPMLAAVLEHRAWGRMAKGQVGDAVTDALAAERISREHLRLTARGLTEREALRYAARRPAGLEAAASVAAADASLTQGQLEELWDAAIRSRGLVLEEMAARRRLREVTDPAVVRRVEEVQGAASQLARLVTEAAGSTADRAAAAARLEAAERILAEASEGFRRDRGRAREGLAEVRSGLPPGTALVSFLLYRHRSAERAFADDPEWRYLALVQPPAPATIRIVPLGGAAAVDDLVARWRAAASTSRSALGEVRAAGEALRRAVWDVVAAHLDGAGSVMVVPDGSLHLVNIASLPDRSGRPLLETGPLLHVLSAEHDLAAGAPAVGSGRMVAVGDPAFDAVVARAAAPASGGSGGEVRLRGPGGLGEVRFGRLAATAREVSLAAELWRRSSGARAAVRLTGVDASEAAFRALAPSAEVVHLATHGFFLDEGRVPSSGAVRGVGGLSPSAPESMAVDPLIATGLVLAGANRRDDHASALDDGILTGAEIATLDLGGVRWAVLSACGTGAGRVHAGEGVFGLERAFRIAGARTVLMSLWAVDDEAAREWMEALYRARLERGASTAEAVRAAALEVLRARRARGASTSPFYWAGFVAAGDWR